MDFHSIEQSESAPDAIEIVWKKPQWLSYTERKIFIVIEIRQNSLYHST